MKQNTSLSNRIAKFIKEKRLALGMNQREFSEYIFDNPKNKSWINKIEHGRPITVTSLGIILERLNSDIDIIEY